MQEKPIKDEILRRAIVKVAIYASRDGYFPNEKGIEKKYTIDEFLNSEEMMAVEPYIDSITEIALGYPHFNEKPVVKKSR